MVVEPRIFLMGDPPADRSGPSGGTFVGECCKELKRLLEYQSDQEAVESMIRAPALVQQIALLRDQQVDNQTITWLRGLSRGHMR